MDIAVLGIDLGKTVCSLAGLDERGAVVLRKRIQRFRLVDFFSPGSERRACRISGADRKMVRYEARRAPDTELRGRLRELVSER